MSQIDLDRLIVRQTYFIPTKPSTLKSRILEELRASKREIGGIHPWNIVEVHKNFFRYEYSFEYSYVHDSCMQRRKTKKFKALVKEKSIEFKEGYPESLLTPYYQQL